MLSAPPLCSMQQCPTLRCERCGGGDCERNAFSVGESCEPPIIAGNMWKSMLRKYVEINWWWRKYVEINDCYPLIIEQLSNLYLLQQSTDLIWLSTTERPDFSWLLGKRWVKVWTKGCIDTVGPVMVGHIKRSTSLIKCTGFKRRVNQSHIPPTGMMHQKQPTQTRVILLQSSIGELLKQYYLGKHVWRAQTHHLTRHQLMVDSGRTNRSGWSSDALQWCPVSNLN